MGDKSPESVCLSVYLSVNDSGYITDGTLRLVEIGSPVLRSRYVQGRLEIYYNSQWRDICHDGISLEEAQVPFPGKYKICIYAFRYLPLLLHISAF